MPVGGNVDGTANCARGGAALENFAGESVLAKTQGRGDASEASPDDYYSGHGRTDGGQ